MLTAHLFVHDLARAQNVAVVVVALVVECSNSSCRVETEVVVAVVVE